MAIKNIIAYGIGFSPGSKKWIPTYGFGSGAVVVTPLPHCISLSIPSTIFGSSITTPSTLYSTDVELSECDE